MCGPLPNLVESLFRQARQHHRCRNHLIGGFRTRAVDQQPNTGATDQFHHRHPAYRIRASQNNIGATHGRNPLSDFMHCTVVHHARPDADPHTRPAHDEPGAVRIDVEDKTFDRSVTSSWVHSKCSSAARASGSAPCVS